MQNKIIWDTSSLYDEEKISREILDVQIDYFDCLLQEKLTILNKYKKIYMNGTLVDLGCSNGIILEYCRDWANNIVGLDISARYLDAARHRFESLKEHATFIQADLVTDINIPGGIDGCYSFSTLYVIEDLGAVFKNIYKAMNFGGICILDLGNSHSLNTFVVNNYYTCDGYAKINDFSIDEQLKMIRDIGFELVEHHKFQLLPLWCSKPWWLKPFLSLKWKKILKARFMEKMLDEWISSIPILSHFAFRHIVVLKK